jgi:GH24 family phage-related lysozyme (muramidase)
MKLRQELMDEENRRKEEATKEKAALRKQNEDLTAKVIATVQPILLCTCYSHGTGDLLTMELTARLKLKRTRDD